MALFIIGGLSRLSGFKVWQAVNISREKEKCRILALITDWGLASL